MRIKVGVLIIGMMVITTGVFANDLGNVGSTGGGGNGGEEGCVISRAPILRGEDGTEER